MPQLSSLCRAAYQRSPRKCATNQAKSASSGSPISSPYIERLSTTLQSQRAPDAPPPQPSVGTISSLLRALYARIMHQEWRLGQATKTRRKITLTHLSARRVVGPAIGFRSDCVAPLAVQINCALNIRQHKKQTRARSRRIVIVVARMQQFSKLL